MARLTSAVQLTTVQTHLCTPVVCRSRDCRNERWLADIFSVYNYSYCVNKVETDYNTGR